MDLNWILLWDYCFSFMGYVSILTAEGASLHVHYQSLTERGLLGPFSGLRAAGLAHWVNPHLPVCRWSQDEAPAWENQNDRFPFMGFFTENANPLFGKTPIEMIWNPTISSKKCIWYVREAVVYLFLGSFGWLPQEFVPTVFNILYVLINMAVRRTGFFFSLDVAGHLYERKTVL